MLFDERRAIDRRNIETGRRVIEQQQKLIALLKDQRRSTVFAESLLNGFERSQAVYEADLAMLGGGH